MKRFVAMISCMLLLACGPEVIEKTSSAATLQTGTWRVEMQSPGGPLPFSMKVTQEGESFEATVHNGDESLKLSRFEVDGDAVTFGLDHYESYFTGKLNAEGTSMEGHWNKTIGLDKKATLPFKAQHGQTHRFAASPSSNPADVSGTWAVTFVDDKGKTDEAIGVFKQEGSSITGTFLTKVGDYRFLAGDVIDQTMYLSCYDGGHAFLFVAKLGEDGTLKGDFWSRDSWHESWTAKRDPDATLPDPYKLTSLKPGLEQFRFEFPDLEGKMVAHDDSSLEGKVRLITIFGSWCPNCNDEAPFLQTLYNKYKDRGFEIVGLAFEMTGDKERDIRVLKRFRKRHGVTYQTLLTGMGTDKIKAAEGLPDLEQVLSYPTTLLVDREGKVVFVHTGFMGPGTGHHYERQTEHYMEAIEAAL